MRRRVQLASVVAALTFLAALSGPAVAGSGDLDPSFSGNGRVRIDVVGTDDQTGIALAIDPRNRDIVVLARIFPRIAVIRLTPAGELDPTFGGGDGVTIFGQGEDRVFGSSIHVGADGTIMVAGSVWHTGDHIEMRGLLLRLSESGDLDPGFSGDGFLLSDDHNWYDDALQVGSKILATTGACDGCPGVAAISRFLTDGTPDPSFSDDGLASIDRDGETWLTELDVDAAGRISAAGYSQIPSGRYRSVMIRLRGDGSRDPAFCGQGVAWKDLGPGDQFPFDVRAYDDGSSISLWTSGRTGREIAIVHRRPSCVLDPTFGSEGIARVSIPVSAGVLDGAWIGPGGAVFVAGTDWAEVPTPFVARITAAGTVDTSFGDGGIARLTSNDDAGSEAVIGGGRGRPVLSGWVNTEDHGFVQKVHVARFTA